jgi:serine/threonine-protein kinase
VLDGGTITAVLSKGPERYKVPVVKGLSEADAKKALTELGLTFTVKAAFDDSVAQEFAIGTSPQAGTEVPKGTSVELLISNGTKPVALPDLRGQSREDAERALQQLGLTADIEEREVDDKRFRGRVVEQEPGAGNVSGGTTVRLVIGLGKAQIEVPELRGKSFNDARDELKRLGLEIRKIGRGDEVFIQFPGAGTKVDPGTTVSVAVSGNGR